MQHLINKPQEFMEDSLGNVYKSNIDVAVFVKRIVTGTSLAKWPSCSGILVTDFVTCLTPVWSLFPVRASDKHHTISVIFVTAQGSSLSLGPCP
jgi:hypothetical protein